MNRQSWTLAQDQAIKQLVEKLGCDDWTKVSSQLRENHSLSRTGKQCRERWYNHLDPKVIKKPWSQPEEKFLFEQHKSIGNRWKEISKNLSGRTDNDVKNHFYSTLRRSLRRLNKGMGEKNSTSQMREIKPSVLSNIMKIIYNEQKKSAFGSNPEYSQLKDLPLMIFQYSNQKPTKGSGFNSEIKIKYIEILQLINKFKYFAEYKLQKNAKKSKELQRKAHHRKVPMASAGKRCGKMTISTSSSQNIANSVPCMSDLGEQIESEEHLGNEYLSEKQQSSVLETLVNNEFSPLSEAKSGWQNRSIQGSVSDQNCFEQCPTEEMKRNSQKTGYPLSQNSVISLEEEDEAKYQCNMNFLSEVDCFGVDKNAEDFVVFGRSLNNLSSKKQIVESKCFENQSLQFQAHRSEDFVNQVLQW